MARKILDSYFHGRRPSHYFPEGRENWTLVIRNTDEGIPAKERYWVLTECASPTDARQPCYNTRFSRLKDARAFLEKWKVIQRIPSDYPVKPLSSADTAIRRATCGTCDLSWDDGISTGMTPAPSARCPFEPFHNSPDGD